MATGSDWTDVELPAAAQAYLWMLKQEQDGKPYSKADVNLSLRSGVLKTRTKASIEYRMQNISAVLEELGQRRVQGYLPAQNVGEKVKARIRKALEARGFRASLGYAPTADNREFDKRVSKLRKLKLTTPPAGQEKPTAATTTGQAYVRDPAVKAWVLQEANGHCEACGSETPFRGDDGEQKSGQRQLLLCCKALIVVDLMSRNEDLIAVYQHKRGIFLTTHTAIAAA